MKRFKLGILLTLVMFGHNFVLNQTQTTQKDLTAIHKLDVTTFNLLYSIPSALSILFIIPLGFFYQEFQNKLLIFGAIALSLGQLIVAIFSVLSQQNSFNFLIVGRVFQGIGAQILYMIQGNLASTWMGKYAGIIFIFPQIGQITNVLITPITNSKWGVRPSFLLGFAVCLVSSISCFGVYFMLKKHKKGTHANSDQQLKNKSNGLTVQEDSSRSDKAVSQSLQISQSKPIQQPKNIFQAGKVFWLVIMLCGINQCLYFPFLDNANELIIQRFCVSYEQTGWYLSIPFLAAIITSTISSQLLPLMQRKKLIFYVSFIPLLGHLIIFLDQNCQNSPSIFGLATLVLGLTFFGMGIGTYYSVSFPAVGLSVPKQIRGMAYACMGFFQTISMTLIPIFSGQIIDSEKKITKLSEGYRQSSLLFVTICLLGVLVSLLIYYYASDDSFIYNDEQTIEDDYDKQQNMVVPNQ